MAKKSYKFEYDSPLTLSFVLICAVIFVFDALVLKLKLIPLMLTCPGAKEGFPPELMQLFAKSTAAFDFANPLHYLGMILHIFGNASFPQLFVNSLIILILGTILEERYGSSVLALMIAISALVSGVLNACISPLPVSGATSVAFMMIILASLMTLTKRKVLCTWLLAFILYFAYRLYVCSVCPISVSDGESAFVVFLRKNITTFTSLAGGICGSLFGFLSAPKKRATTRRTSTKDSTSHRSQLSD